MINNKTTQASKYYLFLFLNLFCFQLIAQNDTEKTSYNYSEIANHPRLLLNEADEQILKKAIKENPEFKIIDTYIHEVSDDIIEQAPLAYKMQGKRLLKVSRDALKRLYYLSYSYRITGEKKYLEKAEIELNAACDFKSWNPSHFLDVGEMCMGVAIAYDWLYHDLKEETKQKVRTAILEKAFEPSYVEKYNRFLRLHNNWNSVCNSGLVYGALAIMENETKQSVAIIERALKSNLLPLEAFGPDGNYPEGPGYWNYGTTFQVMLSAALESSLGSDSGLSNAPGFMESANYMLFADGPSGLFFNYYDCGKDQTARSSMFWFADKMEKPSLVYNELKAINNGLYTKAVSSGIDRILPNALVFGRNLDISNIKPPSQNIFVGHGITPVALARTEWKDTEGKYLGVKGGSASDGHSHMDQGTFVYDIGSLRWAMDFGLQSYITLERNNIDIWNLKQEAERWDVFVYNNLNHNTLTINNLKHNVNGRAKIIESFESKNELGAKIDLTEVLNHDKELKSAIRKATLVDESYLKIEDFIETNSNPLDLRWNMVTPAKVKIIDKNTIELSQKGKVLILKFESETPFELVIRPSEDPSKNKREFDNKLYGTYNQKNQGTVMLGFDSKIPPNTTTKFTVTFIEGESNLALKNNIIVLDAPDPSTASEGNTKHFDISPIGITSDGDLYEMETPDWNAYGKIDIKKALDKSFKFRIDTKAITSEGLVGAGIDRANNGQLGIRGGEGNGIDKNEGLLLGLDLSDFDPSITFKLQKIGLTYLDGTDSCIIVNRKSNGKMMTYTVKDKNLVKRIKITTNITRSYIDVSSLDMVLKGGENHIDFLSLFNSGEEGSFRVSGFEFQVN